MAAKRPRGLFPTDQQEFETLITDLVATNLDHKVIKTIKKSGSRLNIDLAWVGSQGVTVPFRRSYTEGIYKAVFGFCHMLFPAMNDRVVSGYKAKVVRMPDGTEQLQLRVTYVLQGDRTRRLLEKAYLRTGALRLLRDFIAESGVRAGFLDPTRRWAVWTGLERDSLWQQEHAFLPLLMWAEGIDAPTQQDAIARCEARQEYLRSVLEPSSHLEFSVGTNKRVEWLLWTTGEEIETKFLTNLAASAGRQDLVDWGEFTVKD